MGHDITAYNPTVDRKALRKEYDIADLGGDGWYDRYTEYCKKTELARNSRSAGNPLNQVLYLALGVMDQAYNGCSGNGETLEISKSEFETAKKILEGKSFSGMTRPRNMADDLFDALKGAGFQAVECAHQNDDISQEAKFIDDCLRFMEENSIEYLEVNFS